MIWKCLVSVVLFFSLILNQKESLSQSTIKIVSWNIYMLPSKIAHHSQKMKRAEVIANELLDKNYDVIILQEVFNHQARKKLVKILHKKYPYQTGVGNKKFLSLKTNSGIVILSKYPILYQYQMCYRNKFGIDAFSRKGALTVDLLINNRLIQITGTHLQNSGNVQVKYDQCKELAAFIDNHPADIQIVCGDFNINKYDTAKYRKMMGILKLQDGVVDQYSYDRVNNDFKTEEGTNQELIDYVLVSPNDSIQGITRRIEVFKKRWCLEHLNLSDHYAIEAEITLKAPKY